MFNKIFGGGARGEGAADVYRPRMPDVDLLPTIEDTFADARRAARGETPRPGASVQDRDLVIVTPGRMLMRHPCAPHGSMAAAQVASIEKMMPAAVKRDVAVIAYTALEAVNADLSKAIPFAGLLMGLAYLGHAVWVFEGHQSALAAGSRDADVLLVDGGMRPYLIEEWATVAASTMRRKEIYVHDRASFKLTKVAVA